MLYFTYAKQNCEVFDMGKRSRIQKCDLIVIKENIIDGRVDECRLLDGSDAIADKIPMIIHVM